MSFTAIHRPLLSALVCARPVAGGCSDETVLRLNLQGSGTLYDQKSIHLHIFPLTGD